MSDPQVVCLGETMALIAPATASPLRSALDFRIGAAGAESNVACHLAALGVPVRWLGQLGRDPLGERILDELAARGVDVGQVVRRDDAHTGLFVKDPGSRVYYYRAGSAASRMGPELLADVEWTGVRVLHLSGITPALSTSCADLVDAAIDRAQEAGTLVSFDVNLRPALWPGGARAGHVLAGFADRADLVFVGQDEAESLWGASTPTQVRRRLPGPGTVVVKDGAVGASAVTGNSVHFEPAIPVDVVEPVGAGDAFAAGYLAALLAGQPVPQRLISGHRRAALALSTTQDLPPMTVSERGS